MSLNVIAAILTMTGYSTNDTIVIFDRVRENLRSMRRDSLNDVINASVNQTLGRTVITSGTALLTALALFFFGGEVLHGFAFTMIVGIITGHLFERVHRRGDRQLLARAARRRAPPRTRRRPPARRRRRSSRRASRSRSARPRVVTAQRRSSSRRVEVSSLMLTVQAALLGVVQGLTEFLPVSSTAHLLIGARLLGFDGSGRRLHRDDPARLDPRGHVAVPREDRRGRRRAAVAARGAALRAR